MQKLIRLMLGALSLLVMTASLPSSAALADSSSTAGQAGSPENGVQVASSYVGQGVRVTPIGNPNWMPTDIHLFSAPIGAAESGYVEFLETVLALLPPPTHVFHPALGAGPGAPHPPPYNWEIAAGLADQGFRESVRFSSSEFSNGMGVWLAWMTVPSPGTLGSSPDFASGPIIPNSLFPMHVQGVSVHNKKPFDPYLVNFDVPALDENLDPPFFVDGPSHFPIFVADNADFGPGDRLNGSYWYRVTIVDQSGNGWKVLAHFAVAP